MPREFPRSLRLEQAIQRILGTAIASKARDPRLEGVIITHVSVSPDLRMAKVYYALLPGAAGGGELGKALESAAGFLRTSLARELRAKRVPELRFMPDEALARGRALQDLIDQAVNADRSQVSPGEEPGGDNT